MFEYCAVCGKRRATATHHLIFGYGLRTLADQDNLVIDICDQCHNMSDRSIHNNTAAEHLSKMLGQAIWERNYYKNRCSGGDARTDFVRRYGRSWL